MDSLVAKGFQHKASSSKQSSWMPFQWIPSLPRDFNLFMSAPIATGSAVSMDSLVAKGFQRWSSEYPTIFSFQGTFVRNSCFLAQIKKASSLKNSETFAV